MITSPVNPRRRGFTLLELVIAMGLLAILVGMVFTTARTSLALGNTIVETQNEEMLHQAFFELLNRRFTSLPGNTRFDLKVQDSGSHYISDLTLQNVPLSFSWGGQTRIAKAVQLGHHHIAEHQIGARLGEFGQTFPAVAGLFNFMPLGFQHELQIQPNLEFVLDDKNSGHFLSALFLL